MTTLELVRQKREEIERIAAEHGACNVRIFGSVARGDAGPASDIDLLVRVDVPSATSSWFPAGLILDLEKLLGSPVQIVTEKGLSPLIRENVLREAIPL